MPFPASNSLQASSLPPPQAAHDAVGKDCWREETRDAGVLVMTVWEAQWDRLAAPKWRAVMGPDIPKWGGEQPGSWTSKWGTGYPQPSLKCGPHRPTPFSGFTRQPLPLTLVSTCLNVHGCFSRCKIFLKGCFLIIHEPVGDPDSLTTIQVKLIALVTMNYSLPTYLPLFTTMYIV